MKNEEILKQALEKAVKNGYKVSNEQRNLGGFAYDGYVSLWEEAAPIIFSHDFAKAFWGLEMTDIPQTAKFEDSGDNFEIGRIRIPAWRWHLQQMVISENPIKYLEQFL